MNEQKKQVIIGTAGHVDHGKSSLVKALTGTDPDTLPEEKSRSMTIDLGFVFMDTMDAGRQIVFIDVPGHEGLVRTMVAGASNIDAALFIVAADEGIMPQTEEHFNILNLLDIREGFVVITKTDLVDEAQMERVTAEIREFTKGSFLQDAPVIGVSSLSGEGIDRVREALAAVAGRVRERGDTGVFRMPIDRVFTARGFGTVIAGTILSGAVGIGDTIEIYPEGFTSKIRGIQIHNSQVRESAAGTRTALNIPDIKKERLRRGQSAAAPGSLSPTNRIDAQLYLLKSIRRSIGNRTRLRLHTGTEEVICRLILLERDRLSPGERAPVQFFMEAPLTALPRDRFIVRTFSPVTTIGGGIILDVAPGKHRRFDSRPVDTLKKLDGSAAEIVEGILLKNRFISQGIPGIARQAGENRETVRKAVEELRSRNRILEINAGKSATPEQERYLHVTAYRELSEKLQEIVIEYLRLNPYRLTMPFPQLQSRMAGLTDKITFETLFAELEEKGVISRKDGSVTLSGYGISLKPKEREFADRIAGIFLDAGFSPPLESEIRQKTGIEAAVFSNIMKALIEQGILLRLSDKVTYHRDHLGRIEGIVMQHLKENEGITISELRDKLGISRKYAQAALEYFDAAGLTKREGDRHISGR